MKPKFANSSPLYQLSVSGGIYRPDLVFTAPEVAQKFAESELSRLGASVHITPVKIVIGLEEDEHDRLKAEKKTLEAKLTEVNKKLRNNTQSRIFNFGDLFI